MIFSLTWLKPVLEAAGLKVAVVPGWESRGRAEMGRVLGVICHHTAGRREQNMPSLGLIVSGRSDLPGPLAQLGLGRDGTFYVIAAGRANHAGEGEWRGVKTGNTNFIGIEAENTGLANDTPWPPVQIDAYQRGVAAILSHAGRSADWCAGHKEYATPRGRKIDPLFDMVAFRQAVAAIMNGTGTVRPLIPPIEPVVATATNAAGTPIVNTAPRPTLRRGARGDLVTTVQIKCGMNGDGEFDARTEAAVREFQRAHGLVPDGIVGPKTWALIDAA